MLDANALFLPFDRGMELEAEIARWIPDGVIAVPRSALAELDHLRRRGTPHAALARALADRFPSLANPGRGDAAIVALARRRRAVVVTADRDLRDRLSGLGLAVLVPRDRARLTLVERRARPAAAATVKNRPPLDRPPPRRRTSNAR